ncbi:MAG: hypothetical protein V8S27_06470 [Lachnospiraceae bacterium]
MQGTAQSVCMEAKVEKTEKQVGAVRTCRVGREGGCTAGVQKQYPLLAGRPLICHALEAFEKSCVDQIVLVVGAGEEEYVRRGKSLPLCI